MSEAESAAAFVPASRSLSMLRQAAAGCHGCPLWREATKTVFGAGPRKAELMLVGEQPGDREDLEGEPFVGPAGRLLDRALGEAGIERGDVYLTNAVKRFEWRPRGKRRLHQTPRAGEFEACRPWRKPLMACPSSGGSRTATLWLWRPFPRKSYATTLPRCCAALKRARS